MKDQRKTEIKVGIMAVAGLIIFLWILGWAKNFSFSSTEHELLIRFPEVAGLEVGDYVTVNGVRKGNVQDISVRGEDVLVKVNLSNDIVLKKDAVIAVMMLDLMGGKKIEIKPGVSDQNLNIKEVLQGQFFADIPSVMSLVGTVQDDLLASIKDIRVTLTSLNKYLTDEDLNRDLKSSVNNLNSALVKLNSVLDKNRKSIDEITANTAELTRNANSFLTENKEDLSETVKDLRKVIIKTDSLLAVVNNIASETSSGKNNLGRLLNDKEFFNNIEMTVKQLNELTRIMNEQLKGDGLKVDADVDIF
jgi:phospholipid/cholesterol/gamma-HCH transport system substrate-binding protein